MNGLLVPECYGDLDYTCGGETPELAAGDVTNDLARNLAEYAEQKGCPLPYQQRQISHYLWIQASRRMLAWEEILSAVRAAQKRDR